LTNCEQVCAGDLGTKADHLEHNLANITSLAHKWGAIILIDEADVFLSQRSTYDLERNSLVSVFLRHLEYFQGIMFLTTNRVTTFDAAFQSRINFAMKFDDLSTQTKKTIWNNFLEQVPVEKRKIQSKEVDQFSRKNLNGRQVRTGLNWTYTLDLR
jgi:AAA+ superfamily predicted ATPase